MQPMDDCCYVCVDLDRYTYLVFLRVNIFVRSPRRTPLNIGDKGYSLTHDLDDGSDNCCRCCCTPNLGNNRWKSRKKGPVPTSTRSFRVSNHQILNQPSLLGLLVSSLSKSVLLSGRFPSRLMFKWADARLVAALKSWIWNKSGLTKAIHTASW